MTNTLETSELYLEMSRISLEIWLILETSAELDELTIYSSRMCVFVCVFVYLCAFECVCVRVFVHFSVCVCVLVCVRRPHLILGCSSFKHGSISVCDRSPVVGQGGESRPSWDRLCYPRKDPFKILI